MNLLKTTIAAAPTRHQLTRISTAGGIVACLIFLAGNIASAQNINSLGTTASVNSGTYDNNNTDAENGYLNYGTLDVSSDVGNPGYPQFDDNEQGLTNYGAAASASVSGGSFDDNTEGLVNWFGTVSVSGGSFDGNNNSGFNNYGGVATVSGGSFDDNYIGLNNSGTTYLTGGSFSNNGTDVYSYDGTLDIYGTAFNFGGSDLFGDLPQGTGSFTWTQASGSTQTLSYYLYGGNIDLIQVAAAPEASSFVSFGVLLGIVGGALVLRSRRITRPGKGQLIR